MKEAENTEIKRVSTGNDGLDEILNGGLTRGALHLVEGEAGTGKTILGLRFSLEGLRQEETVLYLALSETRHDIEIVARSHGWDISNLNILEAADEAEKSGSMFHPSEVELGQTIGHLKEAVERLKPARLVLDSLSEIRILGQNTPRYRRALLDLKRFLAAIDCTVLFLDEPGGEVESPRSLVDGVIRLEMSPPDYGADRRRLRVVKLRGRSYTGGYHDFTIRTGGLEVFPRLVAAEHRPAPAGELLPSGLAELDALLGEGIRCGSSTLLVGPAGAGKSSIASLFAASALARGEEVLYFTFDERYEHILFRSDSLNLNLREGIASGRLHLQQVDPAELSAGEFAHLIRRQIETRQVRVVVIDSLNGYLHAMPHERLLVMQMHELLTYLGQQGVATFLLVAQAGLGMDWRTPVDTSYLADNVVLFRFFEAAGEIRRAILIAKQRTGRHERTFRELRFGADGIQIGAPLRQFQGILSSTPRFAGGSELLMED